MTKEEIKKLNDLQKEITEMEGYLDLLINHEMRISFPRHSQYSILPIEKIQGLKNNLQSELIEVFNDYTEDLIKKRDSLILCKKDSEQTIYKPTNLE